MVVAVVVGADSDPSGDLSKPKPVLEVVESYSEPVRGEGVKIPSEPVRGEGVKIPSEPVREKGGKLSCPHKESATLVGRKSACARLTLESLCTVGRCYPRGRKEAEHKRQARKESDQSYFEMC
jgi:hypothetical protein